MQIWLASSDAAGHVMAQALAPVLQSRVPAFDFLSAFDGAAAVSIGDGALLCVTPAALVGEQLFFDLGRLQGAVGSSGFVAPVLLDLTPEDLLHTPLSMFQCTRAQQGDLEALVADLLRRAGLPQPDFIGRAWADLQEQFDDIPGPTVRGFVVTLLLPQRALTFGFDSGDTDASWAHSVGAVLKSLPSSPLNPPAFDVATLLPLDVETSRWIALPRRLSRVRSSHLALVSPALLEAGQSDPRSLARRARDEVAGLSGYGGIKVMPWKFTLVNERIVLASNAR